MVKPEKSAAGICWLTTEELLQSVELIETYFPGWWWSLSQKPGRIRVSLGPGQNCPYLSDVELSHTQEGDAGYHWTFDNKTEHNGSNFRLGLGMFKTRIDTKRSFGIKQEKWFRQQSQKDLKFLQNDYTVFFLNLPFLEKSGYRIKELYLGSCDLSVDCSLRGYRTDKSDFDITVDLQGRETSLAESLHHADHELKNDVITFLEMRR